LKDRRMERRMKSLLHEGHTNPAGNSCLFPSGFFFEVDDAAKSDWLIATLVYLL